MKFLFDDALGLGRAARGLVFGAASREHLRKAVQLNRPNWSASQCASAVKALSREELRSAEQFDSKLDYISYIDVKLTRFASRSLDIGRFPVADDLALKRWEQRWQACRSHKLIQQATSADYEQVA